MKATVATWDNGTTLIDAARGFDCLHAVWYRCASTACLHALDHHRALYCVPKHA